MQKDKQSLEKTQEEQVNQQYTRNVVVRFMTDVDKRRQLVPVLGAIFKFSPEEQAKILSAVPPDPHLPQPGKKRLSFSHGYRSESSAN